MTFVLGRNWIACCGTIMWMVFVACGILEVVHAWDFLFLLFCISTVAAVRCRLLVLLCSHAPAFLAYRSKEES